ncbi:RNA methyltransferase [soil metagenome]
MTFLDRTRAASSGAALTPRSGQVKRSRRLAVRAYRTQQREFLVEGPQAVRVALALPSETQPCLELYAGRSATDRHDDLRGAAHEAGVSWTVVDDDVLAVLSDTVNPQGVIARCRFVDVGIDELLTPAPALLAVCADVRDPGNAGTVIRCADAAGADGVVLTGNSVDPYNPKAVRASAGSIFHLKLTIAPDVSAVVAAARAGGLRVLAADAHADVDLDEADESGLLDTPTAWLFGNEAWGLPADVRRLADRVVNVPIHGRAESLNLATAAALCLYASARSQRRVARDRSATHG